jgi:hydroxypyruvate isomerase
MSKKFSANLGFLFLEGSSIIEQYKLAAKYGFKAVEHPFPLSGVDHHELLKVKNDLNLDLALVNIELDADAKFGCASIPNMMDKFKEHFHATLEFAKLFNCPKIHLMSGKLDHVATDENRQTFLENLKYAAPYLERENITAVIEPINHFSVPGYFLNDYVYASDVIKSIGSENIKLMVDLFHMQMIQGNIIRSLHEYKNFIGHVQVAQAPNRNEPDTKGELDLKFILDGLDESIGYRDYIGCEYKPMTTTAEGLKWIQELNYNN